MFESKRKSFIFFIVMNLSILIISVIYNVFFEEKLLEVFRSGCFFKNLFKLYCPGCGGSRSLNALLNFDIISSFIYYPAIPYTALLIFDIDVRILLTVIKGENKVKSFNTKAFIAIPVIIMANFFIRNILLFCGIDYISFMDSIG